MKNITNFAVSASLLVLGVSVVGTFALAGDDGLYEKPVDPNSAFVRVVMPGNTNAAILGKAITLQDDGVSPYYAVAPGAIEITTGAGNLNMDVLAGKFYSVLPGAGKPTGVEDQLNTNPAKAILTLYNLSDANDVDVFVPQAKIEAIKDIEVNSAKSVALKAPLVLDLVIRSGGKDAAQIAAVEFKRLSGVSIIVTGSGDAIKAIVLSNKIAK